MTCRSILFFFRIFALALWKWVLYLKGTFFLQYIFYSIIFLVRTQYFATKCCGIFLPALWNCILWHSSISAQMAQVVFTHCIGRVFLTSHSCTLRWVITLTIVALRKLALVFIASWLPAFLVCITNVLAICNYRVYTSNRHFGWNFILICYHGIFLAFWTSYYFGARCISFLYVNLTMRFASFSGAIETSLITKTFLPNIDVGGRSTARS